MAQLVLTDPTVTINTVPLTAFTQSVTITYSRELVDITVMAATTRARLGGLFDWSMAFEMTQDFAASGPDVTLFSLVGVSTALKVRVTSGAISATNPEYQGNGLLESYPPLQNTIGELATITLNFLANGALTRDITP